MVIKGFNNCEIFSGKDKTPEPSRKEGGD